MNEVDETVRVTVQMPARVADAARRAAGEDFTNLSSIVRSALVRDLRSRGWLEERNG